MKPYGASEVEHSRKRSVGKPLLGKNNRPLSTHNDQMDEEVVIPGDFDRHPFAWTGSHPQAARRPLIDYCTNEWKAKHYQEKDQNPLDLEFEDDEEEWCEYCLDFLRSRKTRRCALAITVLLVFLVYLYSTIEPRREEDQMLTDSLKLRDPVASAKLFGGVFGNNARPSFSDMIQMKTLDEKHVPGKHGKNDAARLIFVGDIHGCKEELQALLKKVRFDPEKDHLVTTGDMIAKGPDSLGTVDLLREIGASCVRGNHEDRILLLANELNSTLLRHNDGTARENGALENPSGPLSKQPDESLSDSLNADQINYLQSCPVILRVGQIEALHGDVVVVHAGLVPGVPLENQDPISALTMRTIDLHSHTPSKDGKEGQEKEIKRPPPPKSPLVKRPVRKLAYNVHWARLWNHFQKMLPEFKEWNNEERRVVVYGHDSKRGLEVKEWSKGLDSGCVSGGRLTALVVGSGRRKEKLVSVKCKDYTDGK
jgi:Calcineurin-like phosphoesterase